MAEGIRTLDSTITMQTLTLASHYDKSKEPAKTEYRELTFAEASNLQSGEHVEFVTRHGKVARAKVNGKPQTWKTRPGECRIPLKYGMYEFFDVWYREFNPSNGETLIQPV